MKPKLLVETGGDALLTEIVSCISDIECAPFFSTPPDGITRNQKRIVADFQTFAESVLAGAMPDIEWHTEHCPNPQYRDRIDIFGKGKGFLVAIELDTTRADQVAKKFVSRLAILPPTTIYFISICYPGTENMNKSECAKYFGYCSTLASRMGNHYGGFIIAKKT